ncbi:MAG TPA: class I adenylate-forming enzyme family protein [Pseudobacteroides sp.]|uniref:class I adenylate-forming enzyme family protein n=1 Tax=Pseudobacteroides sp. TaxID=1968840 RepID=UPI002F93D097
MMINASLLEIIEESFNKYADRIAIDYENTTATYKELKEKTICWSMEMESIGIKFKNRVLLAIDSHIDFIAVWIALWKLNCIPIPMEATATALELERAAKESQCEFIIASSICGIAETQVVNKLPSHIQPTWTYIQVKSMSSSRIPEDAALFFYTSGTTGLPKCVVFDHQAMKENVISLAEKINLSEEDVFFTPLSPMLPATIATAVLPALSKGAALITVKNPIPGKLLRKIVDKKVTVFFAVPYMYDIITTAMSVRQEDAWNNIRLCLTSSAFMEAHIFEKFYSLTSIPIRSIYCSSEGGAVTYNDAEDIIKVRSSVGRPLQGVELIIVNGEGREANPGEIGEIYVAGSHLAAGYYNKLELQEIVFSPQGIRTGDLGAFDSEGYLTLHGRASETINVSGHLVNPGEVEEVIAEIAAISEVVVYSKADEHLGECIASKIVLNDDCTNLSTDEILDFCSKKLNHYKLPRHIEFVKELPKSRYGKKVRTFHANGGWE